MIRLFIFVLLFVQLGCPMAQAQDNIDHGQGGTLNHDYFSPCRATYCRAFFESIDTAHAAPGLKAFAEGNMRETQVQLEYALARLVNHPQMLSLATLFSVRTKNPMWAMPYFEKALSLYPQYAITHAQYGKYLSEIGMVDKGIEQLTKALEIDAKLIAAYVWLEGAYKKSGRTDLARQSAEKARALGYKGKLGS